MRGSLNQERRNEEGDIFTQSYEGACLWSCSVYVNLGDDGMVERRRHEIDRQRETLPVDGAHKLRCIARGCDDGRAAGAIEVLHDALRVTVPDGQALTAHRAIGIPDHRARSNDDRNTDGEQQKEQCEKHCSSANYVACPFHLSDVKLRKIMPSKLADSARKVNFRISTVICIALGGSGMRNFDCFA